MASFKVLFQNLLGGTHETTTSQSKTATNIKNANHYTLKFSPDLFSLTKKYPDISQYSVNI